MTTDVLLNLTPKDQLRAGRLSRRLTQLLLGLWLYGTSMAMMIRSGLGLDPWDVFHSGLAARLPLSFGVIVTIIGALVLLLWIPLRQMPGLGTVANVVVIGAATDLALWLLPAPDSWAIRVPLLLGGVVLNGLAGALYIGAQLGPGPRDGLMTGLARRSRFSLRAVRTGIEVAVLAVGFALGGVVGVGTVLYALAIGPLVQTMLPWVAVRLAPASTTSAPPVVSHRPAAETPGGVA
ncbi:YczE/YyaS/YitT family protein [Pseudactinotalea sp.]|uniref:membrane protein YczE n=1 Tax=Pseudactinotalea sp. TaxID=1926260 RepID=UPI003B3A0D6F